MSWNKETPLVKSNFLSSQMVSHSFIPSSLPLRKAKWVQLNGKTLQVLKTYLISVSFFENKTIFIFQNWWLAALRVHIPELFSGFSCCWNIVKLWDFVKIQHLIIIHCEEEEIILSRKVWKCTIKFKKNQTCFQTFSGPFVDAI